MRTGATFASRVRLRRAAARITIATLLATAGLLAAPVISTSTPNAPVEPTITEDAVTSAQPTVTADFDLAAVVLPDDSDSSEVDVRVRGPEGWSDWTTVEIREEDAGPDPGTEEHARSRRASEPVLAAASTAIEVRVPDGESATVVLIDGGESGTGPAQQAGAAPAVVSRAGWGADETLRNCSPSRLHGYKAAVVHHTVNLNTYTPAQAPALMRSIYAYHATTLAWCDVGYQFLVDRFGTVYEGRAGSMTGAVQGAQSGGFNAETFGVAIIGDFSSAAVPSAALQAVDSVIQWQLGLDRVDPTGTTVLTSAGNTKFPAGATVRLRTVMGHRDNGHTACPGDRLYALLPTLRKPLAPPLSEPRHGVQPEGSDTGVFRHGGSDRFETSSIISRHAFAPTVPVAYIAAGLNFPDALSGAPAASFHGGPMLLTLPDRIPGPVADELTRLRPAEIVVLGSHPTVTNEVEQMLRQYTTGAVRRVAGVDRYQTSSAISADAFGPNVPVAYVASGLDFPDALSGAPAAASADGPLLLTHPGTIPPSVADELARLRPGRIVVLGGPSTVSDAVLARLQEYTDGAVLRVGGSDRYETSAKVSAASFSPSSGTVYVASGRNFPDALSGAAPAGLLDGPLLLTDPHTVLPSTAAELRRLRPQRVVVLGASAAVSDTVHQQLRGFAQTAP